MNDVKECLCRNVVGTEENVRKSATRDEWLDLTRRGSLCDKILMEAGITEVEFTEGNICRTKWYDRTCLVIAVI